MQKRKRTFYKSRMFSDVVMFLSCALATVKLPMVLDGGRGAKRPICVRKITPIVLQYENYP